MNPSEPTTSTKEPAGAAMPRFTCHRPAETSRKITSGKQARSQYHGKPLTGLLSVSVTLFFGTKRRADLDNFHKLSFDALSGIVWEDDSQIGQLMVLLGYDKERPRIELRVD